MNEPYGAETFYKTKRYQINSRSTDEDHINWEGIEKFIISEGLKFEHCFTDGFEFSW